MSVILIADDQPMNIQLLIEALSSSGYILHTTTHSPEVVHLAQLLRPDLILLDVMMPEMNALEVCKQLKASPVTAAIPVIFLVGHTESLNRLHEFHTEAEDYLVRPFSPEEVKLRVRLCLWRHTHLPDLDRQQEAIAAYRAQQKRQTHLYEQVRHDVKNQMSYLNLMLYLMRRNTHAESGQFENYFQRAQSAVKEIESMVESWFRMAAVRTEKLIKLQPVRILPLFSKTLSIYQFIAETKQIELTFAADGLNNQTTIYVDPEQITSAIINLVDNALKYSTPSSSVVVSVWLNMDEFWIEVKDSGVGIPEHKFEQIFNRNYRISVEESQACGPSLGLSIVKSVVEGHGGTISVTSEVGKGSCFTIVIPQPEVDDIGG